MPNITISGVPVTFPFEPYNIQRAYMEKVIECLNKRANGVLESPTGTGKTMSLLCASMGWVSMYQREAQENMDEMEDSNRANGIVHRAIPERRRKLNTGTAAGGEDSANLKQKLGVPKVIYASRTHSQIAQAVQELKRTGYNHMKAVVIGSRDQMCIHPDLEMELDADKIQLCRLKVHKRKCVFHCGLEEKTKQKEFSEATVLDIEDIVRIGKKIDCCPYYASQELMHGADIIFMPYNYLLDPKVRNANQIDLNDTIVILDEAHNVEKMCEESASVQIALPEITEAIEDVSNVLGVMNFTRSLSVHVSSDRRIFFTIDTLTDLKQTFSNLEKIIDEIPVKNTDFGETFNGGYIFTLLEKANINEANALTILDTIDAVKQAMVGDAKADRLLPRKTHQYFGSGLGKVEDLLSIVFSRQGDDYRQRVSRCYKVYVELEKENQSYVPMRGPKRSAGGWIQPKAIRKKNKPSTKIFSYWCFSASFGMQHLVEQNVRSIILTSGTLTPFKPLISELGIPITVSLENPHIVDTSQVCVKVISYGSDGEQLLSNYENRNNPKYISSLGRTILSFCPVVPHGLLVFFPSYLILNLCKDNWEKSGLWSQIQRIKPILIEPKEKDAFLNTMQQYYQKVNEPNSKGAIFMAVCRGKVSEGLDFIDINGRAVIITGIPFPPYKDPRIVLKKQYLDENRTKANEMQTGGEWYFLEASRAVNQAIGRVIRHKNDYGAILLCDYRFNNLQQRNQLSTWIQGHLQRNNPNPTFGSMIGEIARFFKAAERTLPQPNAMPLKFENFEDRKDTIDVSVKTEPCEASGVCALAQASRVKSEEISLKNVKGSAGSIEQPLPISVAEVQELPSNYKEILKRIKSTLDRPNYALFLRTVLSYNKKADYEALRESLFKIFCDARMHFILKGLERFVMPPHKQSYQKDVNQFILKPI